MDFEITTTRAQHRGGPGHQQQQQQQQYQQAINQQSSALQQLPQQQQQQQPPGGFGPGAFGTDGGDLAGAAAPRKAASPEEIAASVYVAGVSSAVNEQTLREFLECCGPLKALTLTPTGLAPEHGRQYTAVYADAAAAQSALVLNSMTLVDRAITVVSAEQAMKNALGGQAGGGAPGMMGGGGGYQQMGAAGVMPALTPEQQQQQWQQQQEHMIQQQQVMMAQQAVMEDPMMLWKRAAEKLPEWFPKGFKRCALFVPIPHLINCAHNAATRHIEFQRELDDERDRGMPPDLSDVSRTVYAGNVNSSITEDMLADFFSIAGNVTYVKFAGSDFNPSRFGFIEFDCKAAAEAAKALSGTMLAEMTVKVKHSNNPIIKDKLKNIWGTLAADRRRARKRAKKELERRRKRRQDSPSSSSSSSTDSEERRRRRRRREERKKKRSGEGGDDVAAKDDPEKKKQQEKKERQEGEEEGAAADGGADDGAGRSKGGGDGDGDGDNGEGDGGRKSSRRSGARESSRRDRGKGDAKKNDDGGDAKEKEGVEVEVEKEKVEEGDGDGDGHAEGKGRGKRDRDRDEKDVAGSRKSTRRTRGSDKDGGEAQPAGEADAKE